jgi:oxygen-dependent protoporphyrinogen oxidase
MAREAAQVVLALPAQAASALLDSCAPAVAAELAALPCLDLTVWHSRHPMVSGWERGFGLLVHPPEGHGLLGAISLPASDPRTVPGWLQLRTYVGGAYPVAPVLEAWPGVFSALKTWLPLLPDPVQVRAEAAPAAFPLLAPGHGNKVRCILDALPRGLHWLGAARSGPGVKDLAASISGWGQDLG